MQRSRFLAFFLIVVGLVLFLFAYLLSWKLEESRDTSLELESGRYVSGSVSEDSPTITTHHFKAEAVLYTYTKYEEYKDSDGDTQRRVLASFTRCARDFVIDSSADGRVVVRCSHGVANLELAPTYRERRERFGDIIHVERSVPPGASHLTVLGRPRSGVLSGGLRPYLGTPRQWLHDAHQSAIFSIIFGLLMMIISACFLGMVMLWTLRYVWGARVSVDTHTGELVMALPKLVRRLCIIDVDEADAALGSEGWMRSSVALTLSSCLVGVWLSVFGVMALSFIVAAFGITPYEGEGNVRLSFIYGLLGLGVALSVLWTASELRSLRVKRVHAFETGHMSDLLLQSLARVASLSDEGSPVQLAWRREGWHEVFATTRVKLKGAHELTIEHAASAQRRSVKATLGEDDGVFEQSWLWGGDGGDQGWRMEQSPGVHGGGTAPPHETMARGLVDWLERKQVASPMRRGLLSGEAPIRLAQVASSVESLSSQDGREVALRAFSELGVDAVEGVSWGWSNRNMGALVLLSVSALFVFGPMLLTGMLLFFMEGGQGSSGGVSEWVALPLTLIPGAVLWFRPPNFSVRRRRRVTLKAPVFSVRGGQVSLDEVSVDLSRPFRVNLSRESLGSSADCALLGVVLVQGQGGEASRLSFSVPVEVEDGLLSLDELMQRSPVMSPEEFHQWVWPLIRVSAAANGQPLEWGTESVRA